MEMVICLSLLLVIGLIEKMKSDGIKWVFVSGKIGRAHV